MNRTEQLEMTVAAVLLCIASISFLAFGDLFLLYIACIVFISLLFMGMRSYDRSEGNSSSKMPRIYVDGDCGGSHVVIHITKYLRETGSHYLVIDGDVAAKIYNTGGTSSGSHWNLGSTLSASAYCLRKKPPWS